VHVNLADPDSFAGGAAIGCLDELRRSQPVSWHPEAGGPGFWAVTAHDRVAHVYRTSGFSSERGMMLGVHHGQGDVAAGKMLVVTDSPRHRQLRQALLPGFAPSAIARMVPEIRRIVRHVLAQFEPGSEVDFVQHIASQVPVAVICSLLGIPPDAAPTLLQWTTAAFEDAPSHSSHALDSMAARAQIFTSLSDVLASKRRRPASDLLSHLIGAEIEGAKLTEEEILFNAYNLLIGGNETTRHAIATGIYTLGKSPAALAEVCQHCPGR
jgi:cytochrome P450